jgi:hypothetical protein
VTNARDIVPRSAARETEVPGGRGIVLVLTFLFMLAAVSVSTGLVVYTALCHDLADGLFALAFAVLSARAALSWFWWSSQPISSAADQQHCERLKPADEIYR